MRNSKLSKKTLQIRRPSFRNKKDSQIRALYNTLYSAFGPQGWWPVTIEKGKEPVYRKNIYIIENPDHAFEIALGAILTQNTSWNNVAKCIKNLSLKDLISPEKILSIELKDLYSEIKSSGYYKQKAIKLKNLASWWIQNKNIEKIKTKDLRKMLLSVNGIGPETADSILLYAFNRLSFVIDSYTKRIYQRITGKEITDYEKLKQIFEKSIPKSLKIYNEYHALLVELAKKYCKKKNPLCENCPCSKLCNYKEALWKKLKK